MNSLKNRKSPLVWLTQLLSLTLLVSVLGCGGDTVITPEPPEPILSSNALLSDLSVSAGDLTPAFDSATTAYAIEVDFLTTETSVTATTDSSAAVLTINGEQVNSGSSSDSISLDVGENLIAIVVVAADGTVSNYNVGILRSAASQNASLSSLEVSEGSLLPSFDSSVLVYAISVTNDIDTINVTPSIADPTASITVNDIVVVSGSASDEIAVNVGESVIDVEVTAQDGTTIQNYQITVTRDVPLSNNADLLTLSLSVGSLTPTFNTNILSYTAEVGFATDALSVTSVVFDTNASVTINSVVTESGVASDDINLTEGENTISVVVLAEDGVTTKTFEVIVTRQATATFAQEAYIKASNTDPNDLFGAAVAVDGDTLVVGASREDSVATGVNGNQVDNSVSDAGAVYVFIRQQDANGIASWSQQAYLKSSNTGVNDLFGGSVAIDGDTLVVGAESENGSARGVNNDQNIKGRNDSGAAYIFTRTNGLWSQSAYLKSSNSDADDKFGTSVAVSGDRVVVGASGEDSSAVGINSFENSAGEPNSGAAYIFNRSSGSWIQEAYVKASNTGRSDRFGNQVEIDGDTVVIAAVGEASGANGIDGDQDDYTSGFIGAVYVFTVSNDAWTQQAYIKSSNSEGGDNFGRAIALDGDNLVVGAYIEESNATGVDGDQDNNDSSQAGAVYVFTRVADIWAQQAYLKPSNTRFDLLFGGSVAIKGNFIAIGATGESSSAAGVDGDQSDISAYHAGAVYLFKFDQGVWSQSAYIKASNTLAQDEFGSVALSDYLVVGANAEDSASTGVNGDQGDDSASSSGAVYSFSGALLNQ